jgi:hypothetical protein
VIFRWSGPHNGGALHAAIIAAAGSEIETRHAGHLDAYCAPSEDAVSTLSFRATGLAPRAGGALPLPLAAFPEPPLPTALATASTPDCSNDDELRCDVLYPGQKKVCAVNGAQHCCITATPVTQLCQTDDDCQKLTGSATAQCAQVQNAAPDGRSFSCLEPSAARCTAIKNPRPLDDDDLDKCDDVGIWPRVWEGELCGSKGAKWRARCFVKNSPCQSDARSCLEGATAQRWDTDYAACGQSRGRYMEAAGPGTYVAGVCCNQ